MTTIQAIVVAFWETTLEMAPFLLLGFLIAGVLSVLISPALVERHLGRRGLWSSVKACLFGIPLPLCSCGVIPVAASIHRHGASRGATVAFLLSTPQTGVDSILVTHSLLGPVFAIFRPIVALITGVLGGGLVDAIAGDESPPPQTSAPASAEHLTLGARAAAALRYGFWELPTELARPMLAGIAIAAVITVFAPERVIELALGGGLLSMLLMLAIGVPTYVCATASVPIAAALIAKGATPGVAFVFLMTGPATNAAAISVIWKVLGRRTAVIYLATVVVVALISGMALNQFMDPSTITSPEHVHRMLPDPVRIGLGVALLLLIGAVSIPRRSGPSSEGVGPGAAVYSLVVEGMTCNHCAESVQRALAECAGVTESRVDLGAGRATVFGEGPKAADLREAVESLGYTVAESTELNNA
ncbi:MAG: permease [Verrucomicrobia bacterium]|nr:permease [Verrucomicrobiota bacterium]